MLRLLRFLSVGGFAILFAIADRRARATGGQFGDIEFALLGAAMILALMAVFAWTPLLGEIVCRPITSAIEGDSEAEEITFLLFFAHRLLQRKWRRLGILLCWWEALIHPTWPTPYYVALKNCAPGSRMEIWFAERVWMGRNAHYCMEAREILIRRHRLEVSPHSDPEIRRQFAIWDKRPASRAPDPIPLEKHVNKPPVRDERIQLFDPGASNRALRDGARPPEAPFGIPGGDDEDDDAVFVTPLEDDDPALSGLDGACEVALDHVEEVVKDSTTWADMAMLDATCFEGVSMRRVSDDAREACTDALGELIERDGVRLNFPTPMAVVRWARERVFNQAIETIDAKVPSDEEAKGDAKSKRW